MTRTKKLLLLLATVVGALVLGLGAFIVAVTYRYAPEEPAELTCAPDAPVVKPGQKLKVLSWNVQYMASKNYVFYYDQLDGKGPDARPSAEHIAWTLKEVARVIKEEDPDLVLLQEMDRGAKRTDFEDQAALLQALLPKDRWKCMARAYYWRADFIPHGQIMGAVGLELVTLSKFRLDGATRIALPMLRQDPVTDAFYLKRAVLDVSMPVRGQAPMSVMNTHLDAFAQGTDTMEQQVRAVKVLTEARSRAKRLWLIGGDFNLLAPGSSRAQLTPDQQKYFNPETELKLLFDAKYTAVPSLAKINGPERARAFTHIPNAPRNSPLDRTIDYIFFPPDTPLRDARVRQHDTTKISDHVPVIATFHAPGAKPAPAPVPKKQEKPEPTSPPQPPR